MLDLPWMGRITGEVEVGVCRCKHHFEWGKGWKRGKVRSLHSLELHIVPAWVGEGSRISESCYLVCPGTWILCAWQTEEPLLSRDSAGFSRAYWPLISWTRNQKALHELGDVGSQSLWVAALVILKIEFLVSFLEWRLKAHKLCFKKL